MLVIAQYLSQHDKKNGRLQDNRYPLSLPGFSSLNVT